KESGIPTAVASILFAIFMEESSFRLFRIIHITLRNARTTDDNFTFTRLITLGSIDCNLGIFLNLTNWQTVVLLKYLISNFNLRFCNCRVSCAICVDNMTVWELLLKHLSFTVWQFFTTEQEMT